MCGYPSQGYFSASGVIMTVQLHDDCWVCGCECPADDMHVVEVDYRHGAVRLCDECVGAQDTCAACGVTDHTKNMSLDAEGSEYICFLCQVASD